MRRACTTTATAALIALALAGCGGAVDDAEEQLSEHFLDPLTQAGITQVVQSTCRFGTDVDAVWHLQAAIRLQAPKQQVADVLAGSDVFVEPEREPRPVWQEGTQPGAGGGGGLSWPGEGRYGWHGNISTAGEDTLLRVVFNNAEHDGLGASIGWAELCPETTPGEGAGTPPAPSG
ncbi:hypothetical protein [Kineococcus sp. SYSU DK005]|uniref:hypothetical protein n=1 Tax=Kineococcus sp. SYSU DK005 TaxID=3383126 RepID=UPI003D7E064D